MESKSTKIEEDSKTDKNLTKHSINYIIVIFAVLIVFVFGLISGEISDKIFGGKLIDYFSSQSNDEPKLEKSIENIISGETAVVNVAETVSPSVVTVTVQTPSRRVIQYNPYGGGFVPRLEEGQVKDIGSGFVVSEDGLIITNKHVVDSESTYKVVTQNDKEYEVTAISKDPSNDIAILKIDAPKGELVPVSLGDSNNLKVGQFVIAIGTALGEFRHTVTTGVVSGLGRGITAGNPYEGFVEEIENVIQTDAAINPGNSGGPLLNSLGEVIGVNVAVVQGAENIGFAIPINIVKTGLDEFNKTGAFPQRPYLGVQYQMIDQKTAVLNDLPQGAYVIDVVPGTPADNSGLEPDDIITKINGQKLEENALTDIIGKLKSGDKVTLDVWRNGDEIKLEANLTSFDQ